MTICLDVVLVAGRYDAAGGQDPRVEEWPPHPARVFSALRSVADSDEDLEVLRQLERLPSPSIHASGALPSASRAYVVTNEVTGKGGNLTHPGRTSGLRGRHSAHPAVPRVQFLWTETLAVPDDVVTRLDVLAARVPYLGRSTSVVMMSVGRIDDAGPPEGLDLYAPSALVGATLRMRVPYPGYTDELNALHEAGLPAWQASDGGRAAQPYRRITVDGLPVQSDDQDRTQPHRSPYRDLIVLDFVDHRPDGRHINDLTTALRSHVMGQTVDPLPPALHGHGFDGQPHVAYLALPSCGAPHADGRLMGLAVAIPSMDEEERRHIIRGVLGVRGEMEVALNVPRLGGKVRLVYRPNEPMPRATKVETWARPSRRWVTATPIVLDRYPKDGDLGAAVLRSVELAGLPQPLEVEVSREPMTQGAVRLRPMDLPRRARGRLYCHARITFDRPLIGPVLVGAGRYFGVGLFQPEQLREVSRHAG